MENHYLYLILSGVLLLVGAVGLVGLGFALGSVNATLQDYERRITELEALTALKPNSRAAMERRDAHEEDLFVLIHAREELKVALARVEAKASTIAKFLEKDETK